MAEWYESYAEAPAAQGGKDWYHAYPEAPAAQGGQDWYHAYPEAPAGGTPPSKLAKFGFDRPGVPDAFKRSYEQRETMRETTPVLKDTREGIKEEITGYPERYQAGYESVNRAAPGPLGTFNRVIGAPVAGAYNAVTGGPAGQAAMDVALSGYLPVGERGLDRLPQKSAESAKVRKVPQEILPPEDFEQVPFEGPAWGGGKFADYMRDRIAEDSGKAIEGELTPPQISPDNRAIPAEPAKPTPEEWQRMHAIRENFPAHAEPAQEAPKGNRSTLARTKAVEYREARDRDYQRINEAFKAEGLPPSRDNATVAAAAKFLRDGKADDPWDAWEMAERETAELREYHQSIGLYDDPRALGAAPGTPPVEPAAGRARTADVVAQEHKHYVLNNKIDILKTQARKIDDQYRSQATPEEWARIHAYGEGDPQAVLDSRLQQLHDTAVLPSRKRQQELYAEIKTEGKAAGIGDEELEEFNPTYMHREMVGKLSEDAAGNKDFRRLGEGGDPSGIGGATEYRTGRRGVYQASELKPRKYYAMTGPSGERELIHIEEGKSYLVKGKGKTDVRLPVKDVRPGVGLDHGGKRWTVGDALTREIEAKTPNRYVKDALHSATNSVVRLEKTAEAIAMVKNTKADLVHRGMATTNRTVARTLGFVESKFPGMGGMYIDKRIAKAMDNFAPRERGEDLMDFLLRLDRKMNNTLFWNPLVHGVNVLIHAVEERGWRNFSPNPLSQYRATRDFFTGWHDTVTQSKLYQDAQKAGAGLMYSPTRNRSWLAKHEKQIMAEFDRQIGAPESKYFAVRILNSIGEARPVELIRSITKSANEATWKINDAFVMRGIREHLRNRKSLEEAIEKVHSEIPDYRVSSEIMFGNTLGGKPAQMASSVLTNKYTRLYADYARFHYNVVNNLARHASSVLKGISSLPKGAAGAKERAAAIDAAGKLISLGAAYWALTTFGDPLAQAISGDPRSQMRAPGPLSVLRMVDDQINNRSSGQLGNARAYTLGMFSPSPIVEMALATAGRDYRGEAIVGHDDDTGKPIFYQYKGGASAVPIEERLKVMAAQAIAPIGQVERYIRLGAASTALDIGWGTRMNPRTPEERELAAAERKKDPGNRDTRIRKPRVRHEDSVSR